MKERMRRRVRAGTRRRDRAELVLRSRAASVCCARWTIRLSLAGCFAHASSSSVWRATSSPPAPHSGSRVGTYGLPRVTVKQSPDTCPRRCAIMRMEELVRSKRQEILAVAARHGARRVRIFVGRQRQSVTQQRRRLPVEMEPGRSLLDLGGLLMDLQELLGCEVDVVTEKGLRPRIRDRVLREAVPL